MEPTITDVLTPRLAPEGASGARVAAARPGRATSGHNADVDEARKAWRALAPPLVDDAVHEQFPHPPRLGDTD